MARLMIAIYPNKTAADQAKAALPPSHRNARVSGPFDGFMVNDETKTPTGLYQVSGPELWVLQSEIG